MKTSAYTRIVLNSFIPLSCEMNILERWTVFSEKLKIGITYLGCAFGGHDEIYLPETAWSKYFFEAGRSGICPEEPASAWMYRPGGGGLSTTRF